LFTRRGLPHAAGLALRLIHDVVTAGGGELSVQSNMDLVSHGTVVTLRFPAAEPPPSRQPGARTE